MCFVQEINSWFLKTNPIFSQCEDVCSFLNSCKFLHNTSALYRRKTALHTDERVKVMNEIIAGMRVIKMYCWEKPFGELVEKIRRSVLFCVCFVYLTEL